MTKIHLNAVHDDDLEKLLSNLGLLEKLKKGQLKCKFTGNVITFDNLYSIFPESGAIKIVCNSPEAIKFFSEYIHEHNL